MSDTAHLKDFLDDADWRAHCEAVEQRRELQQRMQELQRLIDQEPQTLEQLGEKMNHSPETIRQLESTALLRIKDQILETCPELLAYL